MIFVKPKYKPKEFSEGIRLAENEQEHLFITVLTEFASNYLHCLINLL